MPDPEYIPWTGPLDETGFEAEVCDPVNPVCDWMIETIGYEEKAYSVWVCTVHNTEGEKVKDHG